MSTKPTLLVTRTLPEAVEARATRDYAALLNANDLPIRAEQYAEAAVGCDGLLVTPADKVDADVIASLPASVRIIATFSVGYEHIDLAAAKSRGIRVTNTPDVLTDATADIALLLMLAATRRAFEGEAMVRAGQWRGWAPTQLMGIQLGGRRLGILGMGRIGQAVAARARAFGMDIHYYKRTRLNPDEERGATYHATPDALLKVSDVLSIHCPLTPETKHFLNADRINLLPENAVVVNTARGPVVDDAALIAALKSGRVAAAGLDVFDGEPNLNVDYLDLDNVTLLPHLGSATVDTRNAMGFRALDNLDTFFKGKEPPDAVA